jgi:hypothetical protein
MRRLTLLLLLTSVLLPGQKPKKPGAFPLEGWEYVPDPKLPNVLIIGDSIAMGYTLPVRHLLAGKANVIHPMRPDGKLPVNCFNTEIGLKELPNWLGSTKWSVIQFNWGAHDYCYRNPASKNPGQRDKEHGKIEVPLPEYQANLEKLLGELEKTGARLIWASSTRTNEGDLGRIVGEEVKYNAAAAEVMARHHIPIDDLYACSKMFPPELALGPGNPHFMPEGYARLGKQTADFVLAALKK